jgi:hypothetical protein
MSQAFSTAHQAQLTSAGASADLISSLEKLLADLPAVKAGTFDWGALVAAVTKIITDAPQVVADLTTLFGIIGTLPLDVAGLFAAIVKIVSDSPRVVQDVIALIGIIFPPAPAPVP